MIYQVQMTFLRQIHFKRKDSELINKVREFIKDWYSESTHIETKTSGSTGTPKFISLKKEHMMIAARKTIDFLKLRENQNALLCLSPDTIAGKMMIVRSIVGKLNLIVSDLSSNPLDSINERIDFIAMVPLQLQKSLELNSDKTEAIQSILIGGGPVSFQLTEQLKKKHVTVYHTFGMTETISHVALRKIGYEEQPHFRALDGISFSVFNNKLEIQYPEVGLNHLLTNDLVELIDPFTFRWLGRADFVINTGGVKVYPEAIEHVLSAHIHTPFFVSSLPDEKLGQRVVLIVESDVPIYIRKDEMKIMLSTYAVPKEIIYLPRFIRTKSNKIDRFNTSQLIDEHVIKKIL